MNEIATELGITNGALTPHISYLEKANIIYINSINGKHGVQKKCFLREMEFNISLYSNSFSDSYKVSIPIGSYNNYLSSTLCGLANSKSIIGQINDSRYFDDPSRMNAEIIWFTNGYLEYRIPNYLQPGQKLKSLSISQEVNDQNFASDHNKLLISLNHLEFLIPTLPEEPDHNSNLVPNWLLNSSMPASGKMCNITLTNEGVYINENKIGSYTISDFNILSGSPIIYRIKATECTCILYSNNLGKHSQEINVVMQFENE